MSERDRPVCPPLPTFHHAPSFEMPDARMPSRVEVHGIDTPRVSRVNTARRSGRTFDMVETVCAVVRHDHHARILVLARDKHDADRIGGLVREQFPAPDDHLAKQIDVHPYTDIERPVALAGVRYDDVVEDHAVAEMREREWEAKKCRLLRTS